MVPAAPISSELLAHGNRSRLQKSLGRQALAAGALQLGEPQRLLAAGHDDAALVDGQHPARLALAGADLAAPAFDRLAAQAGEPARKRVEGAQAPLDLRGVL